LRIDAEHDTGCFKVPEIKILNIEGSQTVLRNVVVPINVRVKLYFVVCEAAHFC